MARGFVSKPASAIFFPPRTALLMLVLTLVSSCDLSAYQRKSTISADHNFANSLSVRLNWIYGREIGAPPPEAPPLLGDQVLDFATKTDPGVADVVALRGRPDGIVSEPNDGYVRLIYLGDALLLDISSHPERPSTATHLSDTVVYHLRVRLWNDLMKRGIEWDPVRGIELVGRVLSITRQLLEHVSPEEAAGHAPGYSLGVVTLPASPATSQAFRHRPSAHGHIVGFVDPAGASAGHLVAGDLITSLAPCPETAGTPDQLRCSLVQFERHGEPLGTRIEMHRWPLDLSLLLLAVAEQNAFAIQLTFATDRDTKTTVDLIAVTLPLLAMRPSDDTLAFILGHEIGHLLLRHLEQPGPVEFRDLVSFVGDLVVVPDRAMDRFVRAYSPPPPLRAKELEADAFGARLAARAGYSPLASEDSLRVTELYYSHAGDYPPASDRIETIRRALAPAETSPP